MKWLNFEASFKVQFILMHNIVIRKFTTNDLVKVKPVKVQRDKTFKFSLFSNFVISSTE